MSSQLQDVIAGLDVDMQLEYLDGKGLFSVWHLYQLGVQLINSGLAYQVSEFEWNQDDCRFEFSPHAVADEAMKSLLLERYNDLPKYRVNNGSRTYYENTMHGLFILKVALDHLDTSVILAMYQCARAQSSGKTICKYDFSFPNGSHYGDINILDKMIAFYVESNQDCFDQNIQLEQLDQYFLVGQGYQDRIKKIKPFMQRIASSLQPNEPMQQPNEATSVEPKVNYRFLLDAMTHKPVKTIGIGLMFIGACCIALGIIIGSGVIPFLTAGVAMAFVAGGVVSGLLGYSLFKPECLKVRQDKNYEAAYFAIHR